ncbi:MAG: NB-ARC domain-containing protein, partial [Cyanobacteria bacterium P01_A01_bin.17]
MSKRQRGVVLTKHGLARLEAAIAAAQDAEKFGSRFTQAEIEERVGSNRKTIKKIRDRSASVDQASVTALFNAFGLELETADFGQSEPAAPQRTSAAKIDWGEKPDTAIFFGRSEELTTLNQWILAEQCRVVTLLGMGGIGKTSLAAKLADQIYEQFDYVIWRSLREAPPLDEILVRLIQFLSDQQETEINLPSRLGERIIRLLHYLREHRCLLVLDNLESILQAESTGQFRDGYEGYGELIHRIGEAEHQSCLLLTSRECPRELAPMAGDRLPVRLWSVTGIDTEAGREILKAKGLELEDTDTQGQELIRRYSGNPQALHLVATAIQREFLGDVDDFLEEEGAAVEDVRSLLDQHLTRLATLERSILFWLAINREPVGLDELMEDLLPPVTKQEVRSALRGLSDRYLIETVGKQFTLQNVIMEFATDRFVEQVSKEINTQQFDLFHAHPLIKATAKDYVRETQIRLILKPIVNNLHDLRQKVGESLQTIRHYLDRSNGYAAGNLMNLLCQTRAEVKKVDFSALTLRQIHLKGMKLQASDLSKSYLIRSSLTRIFSGVHAVTFSPDGELLATGDNNGDIQIWDANNKQYVATFSAGIDSIWSAAFSPNGRFLASGSEDSNIRLWNLQKHQCHHTFLGHTARVWSVAFSPDGRFLASGGEDSDIRLWDLQNYQCIHVFSGHTRGIRSVAFSPDGHFLASGSEDS